MRRVITFALVVGLTIGTRSICAGSPWVAPGDGRGAPHGAGLPGPGSRWSGSPGTRSGSPRAGQFTGWTAIPAGASATTAMRSTSAARGRPAVPGAPGRPHRDDQHPGGRIHPGGRPSAWPIPWGPGPRSGTLPQVGGSVSRDAQDQEMGTSLADPARIGHRDLHRGRPQGAGHPAQPAAGGQPPHPRGRCAGPRPRDEGFHGGPLSAPLSALPLSATPRGTVTVPRAAATLHASSRRPARPPAHAQRPSPPPGPQDRAHKHRAHKHRAHKHRAHKHRAHKHRAHKHRAHKHRKTEAAQGPQAQGPQAPRPPPPRP